MSNKLAVYGVFGTGGFGREVMPLAREMLQASLAADDYELVFVTEDEAAPMTINGHRVLSAQQFLELEAEDKYFNVAISDGVVRERIANMLINNLIRPFTIKASTALVLDNSDIAEGAVLCPFTTVTSNTKIGRYFHCNLYAYVAHDCVVGDFVTFAPGVCCNGRVVVEDYVYVGAGAVIRQGTDERPITIGKGAVIGMGAVVTKSVPPFTTVVGNPAAELKRSAL